jgi:serine/threonine protein kinase, bacterial
MWTPEEGAGRYRVLRRLGVGGMAEVVLAQDIVLQRYVALKRVHTASDPVVLRRLKREATVGASITHPNLVAIYDVLEKEDGEVVIVMEYVAGDTLQAVTQARGPMGSARALPILEGVAAALDAVHAHGIVHRDVKPANVLLGINGSVKLADLGIAAVVDRTRITNADRVMGSFSYMAPEQLTGAQAQPAIDIYALSALAFEVLSGRRAYPERNPLALAHAIATRPPPDLHAVNPKIPPAASALLQRGMSRDPARRPSTAGELVEQLRGALDELSREAMPVPALSATVTQRLPAVFPLATTPPLTGAPAAASAPGSPSAAPDAVPAVRAAPEAVPAVSAAPEALAAVSRPRTGLNRRRLVAPLALLALLVATGVVVAAVAAGGKPSRSGINTARAKAGHNRRHGSEHHHSHPAPRTLSSRAPRTLARNPAPRRVAHVTTSAAAAPSHTANPAPAAPPAPSSEGTPADVVQAFYEDAAQHDYASAWQLTDENMRAQLDGYNSFEAQMSAVRTITFHQAQTMQESSSSATVSVDTTAVLAGGTQHCTGTVQTILTSPSQWTLDHISISCVPE